MVELENRMVAVRWDAFAPRSPKRDRSNRGAGYSEIGTGVFVSEEDAYDYAIERISHSTDEKKQEFVEWFYSGNWIKEEQDG